MLGKKRNINKKNDNNIDVINCPLKKTSLEYDEFVDNNDENVILNLKYNDLVEELIEIKESRYKYFEIIAYTFVSNIMDTKSFKLNDPIKKVVLSRNATYVELNRLNRSFIFTNKFNEPFFIEIMKLFNIVAVGNDNYLNIDSTITIENNGKFQENRKCGQGKECWFNINTLIKNSDKRKSSWEMLALFYKILFCISGEYEYIPTNLVYSSRDGYKDIIDEVKYLNSIENDEKKKNVYNDLSYISQDDDFYEKIKSITLRNYMFLLDK